MVGSYFGPECRDLMYLDLNAIKETVLLMKLVIVLVKHVVDIEILGI